MQRHQYVSVSFAGHSRPTIDKQTRRFILLTGGGTIVLHDILEQRLKAAGKVEGQDYLVVPEGLAASLNAIGALFGILFAASRR